MDNGFDYHRKSNYRSVSYEEETARREQLKNSTNQQADDEEQYYDDDNNVFDYQREGIESGSNAGNYRSMSYEEAAAIRDQVKKDAYQHELRRAQKRSEMRDKTKNSAKLQPDDAERRDDDNTENASQHMINSADELPYHIKAYREMNRVRSSNASDGIGIFAIIAVFCLAFFILTLRVNIPYMLSERQSVQRMTTFPTTEGTISSFEKVTTSQYIGTKTKLEYIRWKVYYTYEYGEETFENWQLFSIENAENNGFVSDDAIGRKITVYVNPDSPEDSLIARDSMLEFSDWFPAVVAFGILLVGILIELMFATGHFTVSSGGRRKTIRFGKI